jgi:hypothetical protein
MSAFASTSAGRQSIFPVIETGTLIRTNGITKLTGADSYQTWEMQVEYLLISIDAEEIVLENFQPPSDTTAEELRLDQIIVKNALGIRIQTLTPEILAACPRCLSPHKLWTYLPSLYYHENAFTFYAQLQKVILFHQDVSAHEISSFIQLYEKEWVILYRLTTSTSQVNSQSEQYRRDFATFLSHDHAKRNFLLASLMEKFCNEVDNILSKDASSFQEVNNKFLNLYSAGTNGDLAHHMFGNKKNKILKKGTKSSGSSSSKPSPSSYSKDAAHSSKAKTSTWYTKHYPSKANGYG